MNEIVFLLCQKQPTAGGLMWATRSAPPVILCLLRACIVKGETELISDDFAGYHDFSPPPAISYSSIFV